MITDVNLDATFNMSLLFYFLRFAGWI